MEKIHIEMLQHLANGKKQREFPKIFGETNEVLNVHMRMIRLELRAKTTAQAIAIALRQKLIK